MTTIFVSDGIESSPFLDSTVVAACDYIQGAMADAAPGTVVMNVADGHHYGSQEYYVSLLAEARAHRPVPSTRDILAWGTKGNKGSARGIAPVHLSSLANGPVAHRPAERSPAFSRSRDPIGRHTVGVLSTHGEPFGASSAESIGDFARSCNAFDLDVIVLDKTQIDELDHVDALFIRDLTDPASHTYSFARRAADLRIPVVDDPASIIGCSDKIFVHERLTRQGVPVPRALVMTPEMPIEVAIQRLGLPLVLKIPDGSFCIGIHQVRSPDEGRQLLSEMRRHHPVLLAQEYLPTEFDWRIGALDGSPLFACKYFMARDHWQVLKYRPEGPPEQGEVASVPLAEVPRALLDCAARAAAAMGNGLHGIDIKEHDGGYRVIEVNCNPDMDSGFEVAEREWSRLAEWFRDGIEKMRGADRHVRALSA